MTRDRSGWLLLAIAAAVFVWSAVRPHDRFTWMLEVFPAVIGAVVLLATWRRFRLSTLALVLITVHAIILMVGGKYTYALVPLGAWMEDWFGFTRNHYDRIGHFAQGFVPAIVAREILLRVARLRRDRWLPAIVVSMCLAISALYELLEWTVAALTGTAAEAFLGTQGDVWDTQKDMLLALIGAICALTLLSRLHDRSMAKQAP
ncbi:MAG: putative rane protein [Acidobacteriota bacterium]|jgi:putative membrane protein|nr:putative rane protein [Acidobacteriota bacterium]